MHEKQLDIIKAGTGHRPDKLGGYSDAIFNKLVGVAKLAIKDADKVISGMALGWDLAIAQAAIDLDIPFIAAVPFKGQECKWPKQTQLKYQEILSKAEKVVYVCEGGYAPYKMQERNKWMVDNSDILVALWNGTPGGTANCISYAEKQNKVIENYWGNYGQ